MNNQERFDFWLDSAQYDLETANYMFKDGRWFYVVHMCQQSIEKLLKGLYILYIGPNQPHIHNLERLINKLKPLLNVEISDETLSFLSELTSYNLNKRYTEYKVKIGLLIKKDKATAILAKTKEVYAWLLTLVP
jgi:HEPN domain-containing protein